MANFNYSTAVKTASKYGLTDIQLVQGKNPRQCTCILYKGIKLSTSSWTCADFESAFSYAQCEGTLAGYSLKSVARQKINTAHGYNAESMLANYMAQKSTYADSIGSCIKLKDRDLKDCLIEYINLEYGSLDFLYYDAWVESVKRFYTEETQGKYTENALRAAENYINNAFIDRKLYNIGGYVYSNYALAQLVKNWFGENDIPSNESKNQEIVYRFIKAVKELKK